MELNHANLQSMDTSCHRMGTPWAITLGSFSAFNARERSSRNRVSSMHARLVLWRTLKIITLLLGVVSIKLYLGHVVKIYTMNINQRKQKIDKLSRKLNKLEKEWTLLDNLSRPNQGEWHRKGWIEYQIKDVAYEVNKLSKSA